MTHRDFDLSVSNSKISLRVSYWLNVNIFQR